MPSSPGRDRGPWPRSNKVWGSRQPVADLAVRPGASGPSVTGTGRRRSLRRAGRPVLRATGPTLIVTYLSLLVLLPIAAVLSKAFGNGFGAFWSAVTQPEPIPPLKLTSLCSLLLPP